MAPFLLSNLATFCFLYIYICIYFVVAFICMYVFIFIFLNWIQRTIYFYSFLPSLL